LIICAFNVGCHLTNAPKKNALSSAFTSKSGQKASPPHRAVKLARRALAEPMPDNPASSRAERLRAARDAFQLGLEYGCSPAEAVARKASEQMLDRLCQPTPRQRAKQASLAPVPTPQPDPPPSHERRFWWNNL
jgi:hypothetical protein